MFRFKHVRRRGANNIQLVAEDMDLQGILGNISKPSSLICASGKSHGVASALHPTASTPQGSGLCAPGGERAGCGGEEEMH